jgi:hypothetical protein
MNRSVLYLIGIICVASVAFTTLAQAETLVESSIFFRTYLAFSVGQQAAQAWLPDPWKAVSLPKGPFKGTNLYVLFQDNLIHQDGEGKPDKGGTYCLASLVVFGKNQQNGPYKNSVKATAYREATLKGSTSESGAGSEVWKVQDSAGGIMEFRMDYQRAVPKRIKREFKVRSSVEPDIFFNIQDDYTVDVVKSIPAGIDRVKNYKFRVTMTELRKMFDGSEKLVGILVNPSRVRQKFSP